MATEHESPPFSPIIDEAMEKPAARHREPIMTSPVPTEGREGHGTDAPDGGWTWRDAYRTNADTHCAVRLADADGNTILRADGGDVRIAAQHAALIAAAPDGLALAYAVAAHFTDTDAPLGKMARDFIALAEGR